MNRKGKIKVRDFRKPFPVEEWISKKELEEDKNALVVKEEDLILVKLRFKKLSIKPFNDIRLVGKQGARKLKKMGYWDNKLWFGRFGVISDFERKENQARQRNIRKLTKYLRRLPKDRRRLKKLARSLYFKHFVTISKRRGFESRRYGIERKKRMLPKIKKIKKVGSGVVDLEAFKESLISDEAAKALERMQYIMMEEYIEEEA